MLWGLLYFIKSKMSSIGRCTFPSWASLVAQTVKRLPAMQETRVRFLGWEDPLEKEMAIHSRTFAWKIPWTEELDRLQSMGSQRVRQDRATSLSLSLSLCYIVGQPVWDSWCIAIEWFNFSRKKKKVVFFFLKQKEKKML